MPPSVLGLSRIMHRAFAGDDLTGLFATFSQRINEDPRDAGAILDISTILQVRGQTELGLELQSQALEMCQHYRLQGNPIHPDLRLLAIMTPGVIMDNTPLEFLVEDGRIALELFYLGSGLPTPDVLPEHDVAFVAVCHTDANEALLHSLDEVMQHWPRPYLNRPRSIARLSRDRVAELLEGLDNVQPSRTVRVERSELEDMVHLADSPSDLFPLIVRPLDSHAGHGLTKIDDAQGLVQYLQSESGAEFFVAPFIDYRSHDGKYRKYRVVVIDGQPYASHMAVSTRWMVHYLNADMLSSADNRWEEAQFMASFDRRFAKRHRTALQAIDARIELDYYSIDCAENTSGQLVVFEIDSGAVVHSMDPVDIFPYKAPQMQKVFAAFRRALNTRLPAKRQVA